MGKCFGERVEFMPVSVQSKLFLLLGVGGNRKITGLFAKASKSLESCRPNAGNKKLGAQTNVVTVVANI